MKTYLLQVKLVPPVWHVPLNFDGREPRPSPLKLSDSGQIPINLIKNNKNP